MIQLDEIITKQMLKASKIDGSVGKELATKSDGLSSTQTPSGERSQIPSHKGSQAPLDNIKETPRSVEYGVCM